eukprot:scaffold236984_cov13-Tisochrysis_lutea.AAC.1
MPSHMAARFSSICAWCVFVSKEKSVAHVLWARACLLEHHKSSFGMKQNKQGVGGMQGQQRLRCSGDGKREHE